MSENMVQAILDEQKRCRALILEYKAIGPAGTFGAVVIQRAIDAGDAALTSGDVVAMVAALKSLRACE